MDSCRVLACLALCAVWHVGPTLGQSQVDMTVLARLDNLEKQVSGQQAQLKHQTQLITDLQTRVTVQESAIAKQQATINEQQTTIVKQLKTISEQQRELYKQQSSLFQQDRRLKRLERILMVTKTSNGHWTGSKMHVDVAINDQDKLDTNGTIYVDEPVEEEKDQDKQQERETRAIRRLNNRFVLESGSPVAFHAVKSGGAIAHVGVGQNIHFPTVLLNLGAGFHVQHGIFITPTAGLYIFSTSIMSYTNAHSEIHVSVMKNGAVLARAYGHGDSGRHDQGSVTIVTQLAVGDEVWVSEYVGTDASYYGDYFTSFTGCLLWPM